MPPQAPRAKPSNPNTSEPQRISGLYQVLSMGVGKMTNIPVDLTEGRAQTPDAPLQSKNTTP